MTALQRRFDPNFARVKEAITSNDVGEPIVVKLCSRDPSPPPFEYVKGGGGIFKDMAVHDLVRARARTRGAPRALTHNETSEIAGHGALPHGPGADRGPRVRLVPHRQEDPHSRRPGGVRHRERKARSFFSQGSAHLTATFRQIIIRFAGGKEAIIDVCRQAPYGYDQRAEVLGQKAMIATDNMRV